MNKDGIENPTPQQSMTNADNKKSLSSLLGKDTFLYNRMVQLADEINMYRTEGEFKISFNKHKHYSTARRLRMQFWNSYNLVINSPSKTAKMSPEALHTGICSPTVYKQLMNDDLIATFVMTQPHDVRAIQGDILYEGYKYLEEIMMLPITNALGEANNSLISNKLKIIQMMEDRVNGSVVQRSQTYSEQVSRFEGNPADDPKKLDELRNEISMLKKNLDKDIEEVEAVEVKVE
jgi:hypothetical protein